MTGCFLKCVYNSIEGSILKTSSVTSLNSSNEVSVKVEPVSKKPFDLNLIYNLNEFDPEMNSLIGNKVFLRNGSGIHHYYERESDVTVAPVKF